MPENTTSSLSHLYRALFLSLVLVDVSGIAVVIAIFRHAAWHPQLVRFIASVWAVFVARNVGSTGPGFVSSILLSVGGVVVVVLFVAFGRGWKAMTDHVVESAAMAILGIATVILAVYGTQFVWEVANVANEDHQVLAGTVSRLQSGQSSLVDPSQRDASIAELKKRLNEANAGLEARKQMIAPGDPAFDNVRKILSAFQSYRIAAKGQRCVVYVTSPPESEQIAELVMEFSNSVSGCSTFGTFSPAPDTDLEDEITGGMKEGKVLIHAPRGDAAANGVENALSGTLPLERSYKVLSTTIPHYDTQGTGEMVIWLQFGPKVQWTSQILAGKK